MSKKYRVIIAGCGGISSAKIEATRDRDDVEYVGLVDIHPEAAHKLAEKHQLEGCLVSEDLGEAIDRTGAEVVFDCTVPEAHRDITLTALARGCHVLGEKPMAESLENAQAMVAAAQASDRLYAVVQNRRYNKGIIAVKEFIDSKAIGEITTLQSDFYMGAHFGGFRDEMQHVLLLDMAIHTFDAARFLSGANGRSVYCSDWNPKGSWYRHGASATALFTMDDDIRYTYNGSWCSEGLHTSWESAWRIIGTGGSVTWDGHETIKAQRVTGTAGFHSDLADVDIPVKDLPADRLEQAGVIADFFDALDKGTEPQTVCTDNIESLKMVFGAISSAGQHQPVELPGD